MKINLGQSTIDKIVDYIITRQPLMVNKEIISEIAGISHFNFISDESYKKIHSRLEMCNKCKRYKDLESNKECCFIGDFKCPYQYCNEIPKKENVKGNDFPIHINVNITINEQDIGKIADALNKKLKDKLRDSNGKALL